MSSTEEVSQLFTSTSRGAFPQKYVCEAERFGGSLEGIFPVSQLLRLFGQQRLRGGRRSGL